MTASVYAERGLGECQTEAEKAILESLGSAVARYESGDGHDAAATFVTPIGAGEDLIDEIPPEGIDALFQRDVLAMATWTFDLARLEESETPIAWMHSSEALPPFLEAGAALQEKVPGIRAEAVGRSCRTARSST